MKFTIKERIWGSFLVLIGLFVINGLITIVTINRSKKLSHHILTVIDPMQRSLQEFELTMLESKMYTTNWVFLRSNAADKDSLLRLHTAEYPRIRRNITALLPEMEDKKIGDSLRVVFAEFEQLLGIERRIMSNLSKFEDYDDLIKKMGAEQTVEDEIIPKTAQMLFKLRQISSIAEAVEDKQYADLKNYSFYIRTFITLLSVIVIGVGIFLSVYFTKVISHPIKKIKTIINDLGRGIINKVDHIANKDEIGEMVVSVNNLSEKLQETAGFAQAVGNRDFERHFEPLSDRDVLGKSLLTMRDNIRTSEESLLKTSSSLMKRNQAMEQYTFIVSHNLRAPVATILGLAELLSAEDVGSDDVREMLSGLEISAQKLDGVMHDLNRILDLKQQLHETKEEVPLQNLVDEIALSFHTLMAQGIELSCDFTKAECIVTLKPYLASILYNLISNSIKYRQCDRKLLIGIESRIEAGVTIIIFRDNGKGIDLEKNGERLFRLYERFDLTVEGKGMGLFMIKTQVENLGGAISLQSEINQGTEFRIVLPDHPC